MSAAIVVRATGPARIDAWRDGISVAHALRVYGSDTWIVCRASTRLGQGEQVDGELAARGRLHELAETIPATIGATMGATS